MEFDILYWKNECFRMYPATWGPYYNVYDFSGDVVYKLLLGETYETNKILFLDPRFINVFYDTIASCYSL